MLPQGFDVAFEILDLKPSFKAEATQVDLLNVKCVHVTDAVSDSKLT